MTSSYRVSLALAVSILLHLALLAGRLPVPAPARPIRLDVKLVVPPIEEVAVAEPDLFEKNTMAPDEPPPVIKPPPPKPAQHKESARMKVADEQRAVRKLSEHILYPQAAIDAGQEGTVHLLLQLDADGRILHVSIAAGSGYPELDHAALQAALRAGRLNTGGRTEVILPITFRLQ